MFGVTTAMRLLLVAAALTAAVAKAPGAGAQQPVTDPGPNQMHQNNASWDWNWGELLYGGTYSTTLTVQNHCKAWRTVHFFISDPFFEKRVTKNGERVTILEWLRPPIVNGRANREVQGGEKLPLSARAMLSIPKPGCHAVPFGGGGSQTPTTCSTAVPPGATEFEVTIAAPPPPDLSGFIPPPGFDPSTLFDEIAGELVIYHKGDPPSCLASREEYIPGGHVHLDPNPKGKSESGPRCRDWWDREEKPRGLTRDCTGEIRDLALTYLRVTLTPLAQQNPGPWRWLPTGEQILRMSIDDLIAMKVRSRATMRGGK